MSDMPSFRDSPGSDHNAPALTVSELSAALKRKVEDSFSYVRVKGEVSQPKVPGSGHCYLRLKDEDACLDAIIWRGTLARLSIRPEEGMEVIATGKLTTYPGRSSYQIIIESLELAGQGALLKLLEDRRKKLAAEGLFDEARKKPLPFLPRIIGVVTSPTGAVIRDILHRIRDRCACRVLVWPVRVQGEGAADEVTAAITGFNAFTEDGAIPRPDVIIVARGGGSLEDLWSFNEEAVVRAAAASKIPLISAVGHETDWTLIDYAADRRAPTPTAAAEMAVPVRLDLLANVQQRHGRLVQATMRLLTERRIHLEGLIRGIPRLEAMVEQKQQDLDMMAGRLVTGPSGLIRTKGHELAVLSAKLNLDRFGRDLMRHGQEIENLAQRFARAGARAVTDCTAKLESLAARLESSSPLSPLKRGYALVRDAAGAPILSTAGATPGALVEIEFGDGKVGARVEGGGARPQTKPARKPDPGQGTLL
ncbi:MAG: exodeoxyribonuclease VII large subunit [Rhodospirillaceae bacterium]